MSLDKLNTQTRIVEIELQGKKFNAKLDFETIAKIQKMLKEDGNYMKFQDMFVAISEQDFSVLVPFIICSIQRCHPQLKGSYIKDLLTFDEIENVFEKLGELVEYSMPKNTDEKK